MKGRLLRAMIRGARLANAANPRAPLEAILSSRFTSEFTNGKTQISASGNGFSASWSLHSSLTPAAVITLANAALHWFDLNPEKVLDASAFPREIRASSYFCAHVSTPHTIPTGLHNSALG